MAKHDDVIKWKHFPRYWPFVRGNHRSPVNSPHKGQWRGALMFSLICTWINCWVNNGENGDLRRHRAHYDVTVMKRTWIKLMLSQFLPNIVYTLIAFSNIINFGPSWSTCRKLSENIVKVVLFSFHPLFSKRIIFESCEYTYFISLQEYSFSDHFGLILTSDLGWIAEIFGFRP